MTHQQMLMLAILAATIVLFVSDRVRYDVVGLLALVAGIATGLIPANRAFSGFANPVLPLIASALVLSAAVGQSGAIEVLLRWLQRPLRLRQLQVGLLVACVALLSAFMKNVGALAIFMPAALQVARRYDRSPSEFLMPLAFASLLGGSATLIGTSPNVLIASVRQQLLGAPFTMFDFTPVGAGIALAGTVVLAIAWRLIPRRPGRGGEVSFALEDYTSELRVGKGSAYIGRSVGEIEALSGGAASIAAIIRDDARRFVPGARWPVQAGDVLVVEAEPQTLEQLARDGNLQLVGGETAPTSEAPATAVEAHGSADAEARPREPLSVVEAAVMPGSPLIDRSAAELHLRELYGVNVLAISRRGRSARTRLRRVRFQFGDAIVFQGYVETIYDTIAALGCLPLAERQLRLGRQRRLALPLLILAAAILVSGLELVPAAVAFLAAAVAVALLRLLPLAEIYEAIDLPILVMIGAMIPLGEAVSHSGTAGLIAAAMAHLATVLPPAGMIAAVLVASMLVTPVLHHAPAVLVMGPIAASLAQKLGFHVDPFLMAVAVGAGSDFLSPVGHQCNTLVMGPGGYRFADYWHLGLPMSLLVVGLGVPLILIFWPLH